MAPPSAVLLSEQFLPFQCCFTDVFRIEIANPSLQNNIRHFTTLAPLSLIQQIVRFVDVRQVAPPSAGFAIF